MVNLTGKQKIFEFVEKWWKTIVPGNTKYLHCDCSILCSCINIDKTVRIKNKLLRVDTFNEDMA